MINSLLIYKKASRLRSRGYRDLKDMAAGEGVRLHYRNDFRDLLGMYVCVMKDRMIFLNDRLETPMAEMVLAHELGHDQLHRALAGRAPLHESSLFDMTSRIEYEANAFAAHLLLPDEEVLGLLRSGRSLSETASLMNVGPDLLLIKLTEMERLGTDLRLPFEPDGTFLKGIRV